MQEGMTIQFEGGGLFERTALLRHGPHSHAIGTIQGKDFRPSSLGESMGLDRLTAPTESQLLARIAERVAIPGRRAAELKGQPSLL